MAEITWNIWRRRFPFTANSGLIDFPQGDHRRLPAFIIQRFGTRLAFWAFWAILDVLGSLLEPLDCILGCSWEPLGVVLEPLGRSLGVSECSWAPLGHLLGRLEVTKTTCNKKIDFQTDFWSNHANFWVCFGSPKSTQNDSQNETKFETIFKS